MKPSDELAGRVRKILHDGEGQPVDAVLADVVDAFTKIAARELDKIASRVVAIPSPPASITPNSPWLG